MAAVIEAFQQYAQAKIILLTPTPVVEATANDFPDFVKMRMTWRNRDLKRRADILLELSEQYQTDYVDLYSVFGDMPDASLFLPDGLHPNFLGHQHILKEMASAL